MSDEPEPPVVVEPPPPPPRCGACGALLRPGAAFCGSCGHQVGEPPPAVPPGAPPSAWIDVRRALWFYLVMLAIQVVAMVMVKLDADLRTALGFSEPMFAFVVLVAALFERREVLPAYAHTGFGVFGYAAIVLASFPIFGGVALFVNGVNGLFGLHEVGEKQFLDLGFGWAFLLIVVTPPIFEELAFRGVIFAQLARALSVREAIVISAFAFAILHLSIPMLVTHVPLGLYFGWLRARSKSLWPGMLAHALHNGWVLFTS